MHVYRGFKILLFFEADEKSFHKFLPGNQTQASPHQEMQNTTCSLILSHMILEHLH